MICENCGKEHDGTYGSGRFCCSSCRTSFTNRQRGKHSEETKQKISKSVKLHQYNPNPIKTYYCKYCGNEIIRYRQLNGRLSNSKYCSDICRNKWIDEIGKKNWGGYRKGSGIGKSGWYKGIHCDSSWELAFVIYHLEHNLYIERCKERRTYTFENKQRTYIPDFITDDGIIEIKGYKSEESIAKQKSNPDIKVLYKQEMEMYLNYAITKYGKDFITLYE